MALPQSITNFLRESADSAGVPVPVNGEDLFKTGVLDSFALVDFVPAETLARSRFRTTTWWRRISDAPGD